MKPPGADRSPGGLSAMNEKNTNTQSSDLDPAGVPDREKLRRDFEAKDGIRFLTVKEMERRLERALLPIVPHPTIKARTKTFESYYGKYLRHVREGIVPPLITDLMGIRVICPFMEDLEKARAIIQDNFMVVEVERKGGRYSFMEFGYESIHLLLEITDDISRGLGDSGCKVAEVQIRTTLQDAWAEVEHELFYKAEFAPIEEKKWKRKLYAVNANLYIADVIFQEIRVYQKALNGRLMERRDSFFRKVEESADAFILPDGSPAENPPEAAEPVSGTSPDGADSLLLDALTFHNEKRFEDAVTTYSRIFAEQNPEDSVRSIIYKHRGMAYFAQSKYGEAISDFSNAIRLDGKSHAPLYYRGIAYSEMGRYEEAVSDFTTSLGINPCQHYCLFRRAQARFHMGNLKDALSDCDASLSIKPDTDVVVKFRGMILKRLDGRDANFSEKSPGSA